MSPLYSCQSSWLGHEPYEIEGRSPDRTQRGGGGYIACAVGLAVFRSSCDLAFKVHPDFTREFVLFSMMSVTKISHQKTMEMSQMTTTLYRSMILLEDLWWRRRRRASFFPRSISILDRQGQWTFLKIPGKFEEVNKCQHSLKIPSLLTKQAAGGQFNSFVEISTDFSTEFL